MHLNQLRGRPNQLSKGQGEIKGICCGLLTALCYGTSPLFTKKGLTALPSPLLGATVAHLVAAIIYGGLMARRGRWKELGRCPRRSLFYLAVSGAAVGLAQFLAWSAYGAIPLAIAAPLVATHPLATLSISALVTPRLEGLNRRVWLGAVCIVTGATLVILARVGVL